MEVFCILIYCLTNKINNKKYVGQTNNLKRRMNEHKSTSFNPKSCSYNDLIHKKIREYGWDNFSIEVLEDNIPPELINIREIYWIDKKSSYVGLNKGYNQTLGGQDGFNSGIKCLSPQELIEVKEKIKNGISYSDIIKSYSISKTFLSNLNYGLYDKKEGETYPLYKWYKSDDDYSLLIQLLLESELSFSEISNYLGIGVSTVKKINYGKLRPGLYNEYPIRKISPQDKKCLIVKDLLRNTDYSFKTISEIAGVSDETVRRINIGETHKENIQYPLRKRVETIPS